MVFRKFRIFLSSLRRKPIGQRHREETKMDILLSEVGWKIFVPVCRPVYSNLARLGQRTRRTVRTSPDGRLVWRKNGVDGLTDKSDFHTTPRLQGRGFGRWRSVSRPSRFQCTFVSRPHSRGWRLLRPNNWSQLDRQHRARSPLRRTPYWQKYIARSNPQRVRGF
jgi:hypothetical protein